LVPHVILPNDNLRVDHGGGDFSNGHRQPEVDEHEEQLMGRMNDRVLRKIFASFAEL